MLPEPRIATIPVRLIWQQENVSVVKHAPFSADPIAMTCYMFIGLVAYPVLKFFLLLLRWPDGVRVVDRSPMVGDRARVEPRPIQPAVRLVLERLINFFRLVGLHHNVSTCVLQ